MNRNPSFLNFALAFRVAAVDTVAFRLASVLQVGRSALLSRVIAGVLSIAMLAGAGHTAPATNLPTPNRAWMLYTQWQQGKWLVCSNLLYPAQFEPNNGSGTVTNIVLNEKFLGSIQIGTNFFTVQDWLQRTQIKTQTIWMAEPKNKGVMTMKAWEEWMARYDYMDKFLREEVVPTWSMTSSNSGKWTYIWSDKGITNLSVTTNYPGTIQVGTNFYSLKQLELIQFGLEMAEVRGWMDGWGEAVRRHHLYDTNTIWLGSVLTGEALGGGKPKGLLDTHASDEQIGLRSDGFVVWRKRP